MATKTNPGLIHKILKYIWIIYDVKQFSNSKNTIEFKIRKWHPIYIFLVFFISLFYAIFIGFFKSFYEAFKDNL